MKTQQLNKHIHAILGRIPNDWNFVTFEDALTGFSSGSTPSRDKPNFFEGDNLWITSGELNYNIIVDTKEKITDEAIKVTNLKKHAPGTFLMAITGLEAAGTRGSCAIIGKEATTNQSCMALLPKKNLSMDFFFQFYCHFGEQLAFKYCQGTKQQSYNGATASKLPLILPPLHEQKQIAIILITWDEAISAAKKVTEKLKIRNKALAQQLLSNQKRLKGFKGNWETQKLGDVILRITRKNSDECQDVLTISAQRGFVRQDDFFKKQIASEILTNYNLLKKGEFAYNKSYSKGYPMGAIKRLDAFGYGVVTTLYICFALKKSNNSNFFKHYFEEGLMIEGLTKIAQEGGRAHGLLNISLDDFMSLKLFIPSIEEQNAIASVLESADQELKLYEQKLYTIQKQKKSLMQKLLTGQIRVK